MTVPQVEREIMRGGRFAYFSWCFSPVVWTFRRNSQIRFYRVGGEGGDVWKWTLVTLLAGWWSIPGFIFVIMCVCRNLMGGVDVTYEMMSALIGPARAGILLRHRGKPPASVGLLAMRVLASLMPVILAVAIVGALWWHHKSSEPKVTPPGQAEYMALREKVAAAPGTASGNNETAKKIVDLTAMELDRQMGEQLWRAQGKTPPKDKRLRAYSLWCESNGQECMFFMRVPNMGDFNAETQDRVAASLWNSCQETVKGMDEVRPDSPVVISLDDGGEPLRLWKGKSPGAGKDAQIGPPLLKLKGKEAEQFMIDRFRPAGGLPPASGK